MVVIPSIHNYDETGCFHRKPVKIRYIKIEPAETCQIIEEEPVKPAFKTGKGKRQKSWQY